MEWITKKTTVDFWLRFALLLLAAVAGAVSAYYTMKYNDVNFKKDIKSLEIEVQELNSELDKADQNWDQLIMKLDDRYVERRDFLQYRRSIENRVNDIKSDTEYIRNRIDRLR